MAAPMEAAAQQVERAGRQVAARADLGRSGVAGVAAGAVRILTDQRMRMPPAVLAEVRTEAMGRDRPDMRLPR